MSITYPNGRVHAWLSGHLKRHILRQKLQLRRATRLERGPSFEHVEVICHHNRRYRHSCGNSTAKTLTSRDLHHLRLQRPFARLDDFRSGTDAVVLCCDE